MVHFEDLLSSPRAAEVETCSIIPRDPFVPGQATEKLLEGNNLIPDFCKEQRRGHQDRFLRFGI